ncbi:oligosaccharide flippase family protein [Paraglaciecola chathamensis]|uniref:Polysaccharide transporter, PST family n=1 Tax=Paraglaciecola chathamensis S18K6 TaxID=1127672 RepID=A0AAV3V1I1_9ALTE|nr:oligosaccharide flippase family protein [Paraglaciecola chathamensis]GAC10805.1 polysaccharide transporter, PST family [Paraglaciecola chathamensis S18K6]
MNNASSKLINSASLLIAGKFFQRSVGLISIVILARVLTPQDFAIAAIISMVIYFFDVLSDLGNEQYIIQKKEVSDKDLDAAWTINILIKSCLTLLLVLCIPFINSFYSEMQLTGALLVATCVLPIRALRNSGILRFQRELVYKQLFFLTIFQRLGSFCAVMLMIWIYPSFWALIIGDITSALIFTFGSYIVHTFRPSFSLKNIKQQWLFSRWILAKNIIGYTRSQIDTFIVSSLFNARDLGRYYLSRDIVMLPSQNLLTPAIQPLLATFSAKHHSGNSLGRQLEFSLLVTTMLTIPIVFYIWYFPAPLIDTILGEQWSDSYILLSRLSLLVLYIPFIVLFEQIMIAKGWVAKLLVFDIASLILICSGLLVLGDTVLSEFAMHRGLLGIGATCVLILFIRVQMNFSLFAWGIWCLICAAVSYLSVLGVQYINRVSDSSGVVILLISGGVFTSLYAAAMALIVRMLAPRNENCLFLKRLMTKYIAQIREKLG